MSIFVLLRFLTIFQIIQTNQIFFQCTFDTNQLCRLRSSDGGGDMLVDSGSQISSYAKPIQPWSDVSSILKSTMNGDRCKLPYRQESNPNDLYFCSKSSNSTNELKCETTNGLEDQCRQGKYQILLWENVQERQFQSPLINASPNSTCLTFYYYLTRRDFIILYIYYLPEEGDSKLIAAFGDIPFNGWHLAKESFRPTYSSYRIRFKIYRAATTNPSDPFYVAFDEISVREGNCEESILPLDEITNDDSLIFTKSIDQTSSDFDSMDKTLLTGSSIATDESLTHSSSSIIKSSTINIKSTEENEDSTNRLEDTTKSILSQTNELFSSIHQTTLTINVNSSENITSTQTNNGSQTTLKSDLQYSLKTVLGLSIGLGIPAGLGVIGALVYLIKLIKEKKSKVVPIKHSNKHHHSKTQRQVPLKKRHHHRHGKKNTYRREDVV